MGAVSVELPDLPYPDRTRIVGKVSYETMAEYYRAADVCVSLTSSDSSPRSIWEAMASGAPCVLSDLPWVQELIDPGRDALTVSIDANDLAAATLRILRDDALASMLSGNGRALVEEHLDRAREIDRLVEVYLGLADSQWTA
jgi:glycosyltransferase involved in cell wall biosynthesis